MLTERIARALEWAAVHHDGQYRKDSDRRIPYLVHPIAVGRMLAEFGYGEDVVVAGILHDTVEDTSLTLEEIREGFGDAVASIVESCSERDKSLSWEERKARYIEHLRAASPEAQAVSCCDKIHNMRSLIAAAANGSDPWAILKRGREKQVDRHARMLEIFRASSLPAPMLRAYEEALDGIRAL